MGVKDIQELIPFGSKSHTGKHHDVMLMIVFMLRRLTPKDRTPNSKPLLASRCAKPASALSRLGLQEMVPRVD
ncbi:MAG: hypothetical protein EPN79_10825 [Burkholderiaceae bacterium]|nr:MAG: hypothetical protein EPN79_10825 [Burkholderiaceae bacterium]TBR76821.1 MAG: hypothetical protein EPN64_06250 [Burkholderiaceae bacterium]